MRNACHANGRCRVWPWRYEARKGIPTRCRCSRSSIHRLDLGRQRQVKLRGKDSITVRQAHVDYYA